MASINVTFHIEINGKDVNIRTTETTNEDAKSSESNYKNSECRSGAIYQGGGKKPPYFYPKDFFDYIDDGENSNQIGDGDGSD